LLFSILITGEIQSISLIHVKNLSKHFKILNRREGLSGAFRDLVSGNYRTVEAVAGISFDIDAGEIVGYIGPNGAGKSTTIKMMTALRNPPHCLGRTVLSRRVDRRVWNLFALAPAKRVLWGLLVC
jgi:ABC-type multidrug transport system ATPase subunit